MKLSLEIIKNEKFLLNFVFDVMFSLRAALWRYWYVFFISILLAYWASAFIYTKQKKFFFISGLVKFGSLKTPNFESGVIELTSLAEIERGVSLTSDIYKENFGFSKKDFASFVKSDFVSDISQMERFQESGVNKITNFNHGLSSGFFTIKGEGTDLEELYRKAKEFLVSLGDLYDRQFNLKFNPLFERKVILLDEKKSIEKKLKQLVLVEKEFGYTEDVRDKRNNLKDSLLKIKEQLLDFSRATDIPRVENLKVISLGFSKTPINVYSHRSIFAFILFLSFLLFVLPFFIIMSILEFKKLPPNVGLLDIKRKKFKEEVATSDGQISKGEV
ncbi:MAG: hypothetical protein CME61_03435 [Halobacteriovoraceae bacterium]|nr:hypothetical protein [Halobacteriovoraceae bacterium]